MTQRVIVSPVNEAAMNETRVIKRYANRKMYDTSRSCYVTLEEVAEMVRDGHEVQVIDNKTKDDLTEVTLTQALLDSERKKRGTVPLSGLRHLITSGQELLHKKVTEPVIRVRSEAERSLATWKDEAGRRVDAWKTEAERRAERVLHRTPAEQQAAERAAANDATPKLGGLVDEWQHRMDERIRHAIVSLGLGHDDEELTQLRQRVEELESRLAALEARKVD